MQEYSMWQRSPKRMKSFFFITLILANSLFILKFLFVFVKFIKKKSEQTATPELAKTKVEDTNYKYGTIVPVTNQLDISRQNNEHVDNSVCVKVEDKQLIPDSIKELLDKNEFDDDSDQLASSPSKEATIRMIAATSPPDKPSELPSNKIDQFVLEPLQTVSCKQSNTSF
eukprot:TRINITY_DN12052_c0_g1_i1.p1 TRINITY_DN12052_c0_g1~~TRINITY_DN12052_c0_g1_i1.p1  ORF type:complete len:170 (+),score=17.28 TRINITY_DN12052_c0_g1_i1:203-712(+)